MQAAGEFEEEALVEGQGGIAFAEDVFAEDGEPEEGVVGENVGEVEGNEFFEEGDGGGVAAFGEGEFCAAPQDFVGQGVAGPRGGQRIEQGAGFVVAVLEGQQVGGGEQLHRRRDRVEGEVVRDEEGQVDGVV